VECSTRQPDLVIVDLGLPDEDGKTLIRDLRGWSRMPVVVLSERDRESEKAEALNLGADDYLTKPFGVPEAAGWASCSWNFHAEKAG
jgi:two-component system KDP operon response regulator KdpE